jgi:hypothetical protein
LKKEEERKKMKKLGLFSLAVAAAIAISPAAKADDVGFEIHYTDAQTGGSLINTTLYVDAVSQSAATCGGSATACYLVDALDTNYLSTGFDLIAYPGTGTFTPGGIIPAGTTNSAWSDNVVDNLLSVDAGGNVSFNPNDPLGGLGYTDTTPLFAGGPDNAYFFYLGGPGEGGTPGQYYEYQFAQSNQTGNGTPLINVTFTEFAVPDGGTTLALLGLAVAGLAGLRRKLSV